MAVLLVKPGLVKSAPITGGNIGETGTDFYIKLMDAEYDFYSPAEETTGSNDDEPVWENNFLLYGDCVLRGAMVASQVVGIANLVLDDGSGALSKNPLGGAGGTLHTFKLGGDAGTTEHLKFNLFVERIQIEWARTAQFVGVAISGKMSEMTQAEAEGIEA
jgi:hypothetical protein